MSLYTIFQSSLPRFVGAAALALSLTGVASAQVYSFNQFLSGGGGGQDPQKQRLTTSMGAYICMGIGPGTDRNSVRFTIVSKIPQPNARIGAIAFDLGRHAGLLRSVAVTTASPGVKASVAPAQTHPFLRGLTPEFWIGVDSKGHLKPDGLSPGRLLAISATLGDGKTIDDVFKAFHEGLNPTTGANGLRVGVIVMYLLGGPPPGVGTIQDDGGFVATGPSDTCR